MTYYRNRYGLVAEDFPQAEKLWKGLVTLPIYPSLSDEELGYIVDSIKNILK
ncbi:MAG: DegT/DnrJ/EryC1/StrS family aminotransferase [Thermodesulfobacteriota bacterium]